MIKIIALTTMLIDHVARIYLPDNLIFSIVGRLSFPLFAWGIAKGFTLTRNYKKYLIRLLILAVVSQLPYSLLFKNGLLNIGFTLLTGLIAIKFYDTPLPHFIKWPAITTLLIISHIARFEYGPYGICVIIIFYIFSNKNYLVVLQGVLTFVSIIIFRYDPLQLFSVLSALLILFLTGYDFKLNRWLQYSFYPVHLLIILLFTYLVPKQ